LSRRPVLAKTGPARRGAAPRTWPLLSPTVLRVATAAPALA